ncbi:MAG TPA: hypothetical protein VKP03_02400 [Patescibacteria group bacterium]|nr:hypothetical protein [Patescibacteria group bacterium]
MESFEEKNNQPVKKISFSEAEKESREVSLLFRWRKKKQIRAKKKQFRKMELADLAEKAKTDSLAAKILRQKKKRLLKK